MAWGHQATNLYLNECWSRSPMPCVITRPQSVNTMASENLVKQWASATTLFSLYGIFCCMHAKGEIKPLWLGVAIQWHRSELILTQVMNGLLPDGTKPLPKTMLTMALLPDGTKPWPKPKPKLTNHHSGLVAFTWGQFSRKCSRYLYLICIFND